MVRGGRVIDVHPRRVVVGDIVRIAIAAARSAKVCVVDPAYRHSCRRRSWSGLWSDKGGCTAVVMHVITSLSVMDGLWKILPKLNVGGKFMRGISNFTWSFLEAGCC